jgi:hypothetical protein
MAVTVKCPECDAPIQLDDKNRGMCPKCNLNVGAIYEKHRHEVAYEKYRKQQQPTPAPAPAPPEPEPVDDGRDDDPFNFTGKRR